MSQEVVCFVSFAQRNPTKKKVKISATMLERAKYTVHTIAILVIVQIICCDSRYRKIRLN